MKSLVIYYTRDGHTEKSARVIAKEIKADVLKIEEEADRKGLMGYLKAGWDAIKEKEVTLVDSKEDISGYDVILFGAPIWGWKPAPAIITHIDTLDLSKKKIVNFVMMGSSCGKSLDIMMDHVKKSGGNVIDSISIKTNRVKESDYLHEARMFAAKVKTKF